MSKLTECSIVGELVLTLTEQGFRVELCALDGGGLHLYAVIDGEEKPADGWKYWVKLVEGNGPNIISDYSVNIEPYIQEALKLSNQLEEMAA